MNLTELLDATDRAGITFDVAPGGQLQVAPADAIMPDIATSQYCYPCITTAPMIVA